MPPLQPFTVGALGNFPYLWQDPRTLRFNSKTYRWISSSLKAGADPVRLAGPFTNLFISALGKVFYSLSSIDQDQLNRDQRNAVDQQGALLLAWKNAFGSLPGGTRPPIDTIIQTITTQWASPPTTLTALQTASDLKAILNKTPASGQPVLVPLSNYLSALNRSVPLLNESVMDSGYLQDALAAAQTPTEGNGALQTNDGAWQPAFAVATPVDQILQSLNSQDAARSTRLELTVSRPAADQLSVRMPGRASPVALPADQLLEVTPLAASEGGGDLFLESLRPSSPDVSVALESPGVTMVHFGPVYFEKSTLKSWFWPSPIVQAIKNGSKDVSGFKFSPNPQIDFSTAGPFAYLTGVAISRNPSLSITHQGASGQELGRVFKKGTRVDVSFLGEKLSEGSAYVVASDPIRSAIGSEVRVVPEVQVASSSLDSTAFVLGVQTEYPAAS